MPAPVTGVLADLEGILLTPEQIQSRVAVMAAELNRHYAGKVVSVLA
jgi:hypoxanthine-guanine phosphoribosyltransferase